MDSIIASDKNATAFSDTESAEIQHNLFSAMSEAGALIEMLFDEGGTPDTFVYLDVNPSWEKMSGIPREKAIGKRHHEVFRDFDFAHIDFLAEGLRTGVANTIESHPYRDKFYHIFAYRFAPNKLGLIFTDVTEQIFSVDITDQIRVETGLQERHSTTTSEGNKASRVIQENNEENTTYLIDQKQFEDLIDLMPAYLVVLTPDHRIVNSNRYFREQFGDPDGLKCYECLFGRSEACDVCESYKPLETMNSHRWTWEGPDGKAYDVHDFPYRVGDTLMILEIGIDITTAKKSQKDLDRMNRYNRELIEINMDVLMTVKKSGEISDVNETAIAVTKLTREELVGADFLALFADKEKASMAFERAFEEGRVRDFELELKGSEGQNIPVTFNAVVFKTEEGEPGEVFADLRNQTDFKKKEEELLRLNRDLENLIAQDAIMHQQLVQAEKLAAMGRMLASITHEINNPLQTIKNSLYLIKGDLEADEPVNEYLDIAYDETHRISNLVGQLREIYRPSTQNVETGFDLISMVSAIELLLRGQMEAGNVDWIIQLPTMGEWHVRGDEDQMKQVFINICNNAIEAMQPNGGQLEISFRQGNPGSHEAGVFVRDAGPGISPEYMDRLFEPFQTTKAKGAGLGLAISYEIVKKHNGRLDVRNYDKGAEVSVWLPLI
jgi:PAS domain S-box-containing protein